MIVNQQALVGITTGFKTIFNKVFETSTPLWDKIATKVPSETGEESYKWLGKIPQMREWIGDREIQNLTGSDYTVKNKDFELTIGVDRNDIEDDKIGVYNPVIQDIAQSTVNFPDVIVFKLVKGGFVEKCYDGQPFFSNSHKVGKNTVSNMGDKKLSVAAYAEARSGMMSLVDENGNSLNLIPNLLVVAPAEEGMARKILLADQIEATDNVFKGTAELMVVPALAGADTAWYLLCTTKALKPFIFQERKAPKFDALIDEKDENVFMRKQFLYGVHSRANGGYGFWQMAFGSTGTVEESA